MYVNLLKYMENSCLLAYCLGLGLACCSSHSQLGGCTLQRVEHLHTNVLQTAYSQQKPVTNQEKMLEKTMEELTKHTKKLFGSVEIKYQGPRTEGQECEGREFILEHSGIAVDFIEVDGVEVARVVSVVKGLTIRRSKAWKAVMDEINEIVEIMKQSIKLQVSGETPSLLYLGVNQAGRRAGNHPR